VCISLDGNVLDSSAEGDDSSERLCTAPEANVNSASSSASDLRLLLMKMLGHSDLGSVRY